MYGASVNELPHKWQKFVEMIQFVFSTKCRRAFILPFFDASYDITSMCNSCDACGLLDDAGARIDIRAVARIILKVIRECQQTYHDGIMFTRVKDAITCHGVSPKTTTNDSDARLLSRGIGARSGFPVRNKAVLSIAVNYLLNGDILL